MKGDEVGLREQRRQRFDLAGGTERHDVDDVVEDDAHPKRFGEDRELRTDVAVTDDAERLPADLPAALGLFVPDSLAHLEAALKVLPRERNDLGYDELCDGTRVGEGRIKDGDTGFRSGDQVDLIYADAEAPDDEELKGHTDEISAPMETSVYQGESLPHLRGSFYHPFGDLGLAANTNGVVCANMLDKIILAHRFCVVIDSPAIGLESFDGVLADVF